MSKRVAILSYPGQALFELGCAVEMFALFREEIEDWYRGEVVTFSDEVQSATGGVQIACRRVSDLNEFDVFVVPSWASKDKALEARLCEAMRDLYARGGELYSFCSGAFLLAEAGLLNGRKAVTHWRFAERFQQRYPDIEYSENVLFELDGRIGVSAGSAAGLDLGLEVIRRDYGYQAANCVARRAVISAQRNGGQSQYVETPVPSPRGSLAPVLDWALQNLDRCIDVNQLADKANMSRRTFDRKFRATLNISPKTWLVEQRIAHAKRQLENSSDSIETIAHNSGFESAMAMRHHFRKTLGLPPSAFRQNLSQPTAGA